MGGAFSSSNSEKIKNFFIKDEDNYIKINGEDTVFKLHKENYSPEKNVYTYVNFTSKKFAGPYDANYQYLVGDKLTDTFEFSRGIDRLQPLLENDKLKKDSNTILINKSNAASSNTFNLFDSETKFKKTMVRGRIEYKYIINNLEYPISVLYLLKKPGSQSGGKKSNKKLTKNSKKKENNNKNNKKYSKKKENNNKNNKKNKKKNN